MKQPLFIGNTKIDEKRISFIETVVARLARRSKKTATVVMSPIPISGCMIGGDVRGEVLGYMFCLDGVVDRVSILLSFKPKNTVNVEVRIADETSERIAVFNLERKSESYNLAESVKDGERVIVSVTPRDPEEKLTEVWVAFTWTPLVNDAKVMKYLFDDVEKAAIEWKSEVIKDAMHSNRKR